MMLTCADDQKIGTPVVGSIDQCRGDVATSLRKVDYILFEAKITTRQDVLCLNECICRVTQKFRACGIQFNTRLRMQGTKRPRIVGDAHEVNVRSSWGDVSDELCCAQRG